MEFDRRVTEAKDADIRDVAHRLPVVVGILEAGGSLFKVQMAAVARILFDAYVRARKADRKETRISAGTNASILAALQYLCDPLDLIPDYVPGWGFVDDAYVLNLCIRRIRRSDRRGYVTLEKRLRRILK